MDTTQPSIPSNGHSDRHAIPPPTHLSMSMGSDTMSAPATTTTTTTFRGETDPLLVSSSSSWNAHTTNPPPPRKDDWCAGTKGCCGGGGTSFSSSSSSSLPQRLYHVLQVYWHLGWIAFGGPSVHVAIFRDHLVRVHAWLDEDVFLELFALGQGLPGPSSTQLVIGSAATRGGVWGGLLAFVLWAWPGALVLTGFGLWVHSSSLASNPPNDDTGGGTADPSDMASHSTSTSTTSMWLVGVPPAAVSLIFKATYGFCQKLHALEWIVALVSCVGAILVNAGDPHLPSSSVVFPVLLLAGALTLWIHHLLLQQHGGVPHPTTPTTSQQQQQHNGRNGWHTNKSDYDHKDDDKEGAGEDGNTAATMTLDEEATQQQQQQETNLPFHRTHNSHTHSSDSPNHPPQQQPHTTHERDEMLKRQIGITIGQGFMYFGIWAVTLLVLVAVVHVSPTVSPDTIVLMECMFRIGSLIYGGAVVMIPMAHAELVTAKQWISEAQFFQGLGLAQSLPGPLCNFAAFLGAVHTGSIRGAVVAQWSIFAPGILWILALLPLWSHARHLAWFKALLQGLNAAAVGLIGGGCLFLYTKSVHTAADAVVFCVAGALATLYQLQAPGVIGAGVLLGALCVQTQLGQVKLG